LQNIQHAAIIIKYIENNYKIGDNDK